MRSRRWVRCCTHCGTSTSAFDERRQRVVDRMVASQHSTQYQGIFERHGCTLGHVGRCRVSCIADQHNTTPTPGLDCDLLDAGEVDRIEASELIQNAGHGFGEVAE